MALAQSKFYTEEDYYNLPENIRAELIDGQIYYMAAPSRIHQELVHFFDKVIGNYIDSKNDSCKVYPAPFAVNLFDDKKTIVEPDISVICDLTKLTDLGCTGAPDWIIEIISPSNPGNDYVRKLNLYSDAGVREYWITDPLGKTISVYDMEKKKSRAEMYTFNDKIKVNIYDDLWIDFKTLTI